MNIKLDLLTFHQHLQYSEDKEGKTFFFDPIRRKKVRALPEEMVRQLCLHYLIHVAAYPKTHIQVEKSMTINGVKRRYDIIVFTPDTKPFMLIECKSYKVKLNQVVFDQVALYNLKNDAPYLWVTNGEINYLSAIDQENESFQFLKEFPIYSR